MEKLQLFFQTSPVDATQAGHALWLIIALPLLGALISGVAGKVIGRANVHLVTIGAVLGEPFKAQIAEIVTRHQGRA